MVIHSGGKASGFKNRQDADEYDKDGTALFHVRGTEEENTRAVQVEEKAASLNSGDCFVLQTPATVYVWKGAGANDVEAHRRSEEESTAHRLDATAIEVASDSSAADDSPRSSALDSAVLSDRST